MDKIEDAELTNFIKEYDKCFLERNIEKLKSFYPEDDNELVYFDNHKNNDTYSVDEHLKLLYHFFKNGKTTESGTVEELTMENIHYFKTESSACVCFYARYKSFPEPAVRTTMYLEKNRGVWKMKHVHCSFEPEK
ncbi:nuclear transport factor 2 family protein [Desulfosporosinus sp.]|uniref:nuclear transport factor 2 family protein n=1 Tax=Desulfosporosinus sp. TaxID=157907 RepID=UPI0025C0AE66|nr:nuclear transport factor 2 family protein [Desulfosporosinus sp.]MBC2725095.1 nuclear transport factor 2 family protein [Desulfosporosinus sp.]